MMDTQETPQAPPASDDELAEGNEILDRSDLQIEKHRKGTAQLHLVDPSGEPWSGIQVEIKQVSQDFLFGNLVFDLVWEDRLYRPDLFKQRFLELFNLAILPFYWSSYEKKPGMVEWQRMLPVLEWCLVNGITPKGHPLVWPYSAGIPEWIYEMPASSIESLIHARVAQIVKGFKPFISIWDVTNEAVNHISWDEATDPSFHARYHETDLWRGIPVAGAFKREIPIKQAADWVEKSVRWAYAANPQATLIINDYNQEVDENIRQRFFDLIRELLDRDVPLSGIGLQVHPLNHWIWPQQMRDTLDMYLALDLPIHITELHQPVWDQEIEGGWREGDWTEDAQAEFIEQLYRQFFGHPGVVSINYWGLSDRNIWIQGAGLVDENYQPKTAFRKLKELIKGEWTTPLIRTQTDGQGRIEFTGFFGKYELAVQRTGKKTEICKIHLAQNEENHWEFHI